MATLAPPSASKLVVAAPRPDAPPVAIAATPSSSITTPLSSIVGFNYGKHFRNLILLLERRKRPSAQRAEFDADLSKSYSSLLARQILVTLAPHFQPARADNIRHRPIWSVLQN